MEVTQEENTEVGAEALFPTMTFVVADPRLFDGNPYEVAERALNQAAAVANVLEKTLDAADRMARNAEMERAFAAHEEPKGSEWRMTPQGKQMAELTAAARMLATRLKFAAVAAGYNPRNPPR